MKILQKPCLIGYNAGMKTSLISFLLCLASVTALAQGAPPHGNADQPYVMEYYYKVQWGHQQEFLQLFLKNHYPLLMDDVKKGRAISVKVETPSNHMTEESRWDYRVTIVFKNSTMGTTADADEQFHNKLSGQTRKPIRRKNNGVSKFCWPIGTCR